MSVAVIIPAFNAAAFMRQAIESAFAQTIRPKSILVIDDGSTDGTPDMCREFGDAIAYVRQENAGVSVARNNGAKQVSAEWLLFLDADDRLLPEAVETLLNGVTPESGVVYGQTIHFEERSAQRRVHGSARAAGQPPAPSLANFWKSAIATPGAAVIRADVFEKIGGFDPALNTLADRDLWIKAGAISGFVFAERPVVEKRDHGANMCADRDRALYQAAIVQLGFLDWCEARAIDSSFLRTTPGAIIDNVLRKAIETQRCRAIEQIVRLADQRRIATALVEKSRRYAGLSPAAAMLDLRVRAACRRVADLFAGK